MPDWGREVLTRLASLNLPPAREAEIVEEVAQHLEDRYQELVGGGATEDEARRVALEELSDEDLLARGLRRVEQEVKQEPIVPGGGGKGNFLASIWQDVRYGLRMLVKNPGFTAVVVLSLALGIGANTAIFSLIDAVMLKTLPVRDPGRLVLLNWTGETSSDMAPVRSDSGSENEAPFSYPTFEELRARNQAFSSLFGFVSLRKANINIDGQTNLAEGELITGNYFSGLGVAPILGRAITPGDEKPSAPRAAVISYGYWSGQFGRSPVAVGKSITVNGVPFTIVGVTPPEFFGVQPGRAVDVWVPLVEEAKLLPYGRSSTPGDRPLFTSRDWWWLIIMGRLKPGVTEQQATPQLEVLFQQSITAGLKTPPKPGATPHVRLEPATKGLDLLRQEFSKPLWILMIVVGVVLLIACANVATLLVARSTARQKEIAVRLSLGAPRARLIRQLLTESVLLGGLGGALGLLFAYWGSHALVLLMSSGGELLSVNVQPDAKVLAFTAAVSVLTGILFGLAPALRSTRVDLTPVLKASAGSIGGASRRTRLSLGKSLVVAQVSLSLPLLMGAGLFVRTLGNLESQNLGFNQNHLLLFGIDPAKNGYKGERLNDFCGRLLARLQALPGARSATMSEVTLASGVQDWLLISIEGHKPKPGENMGVDWNNVGPSFFETMGIRLLLGRGVEWRDTTTSPRVAVVNEVFARLFLDGRNPIGYRVSLNNPFSQVGGASEDYEVVGMVQDAKYASLRSAPRPTVYVPFDQNPWPPWGIHYEVRVAGDPLALVPTVRRVVHDLEPNLPLADVKTQTEQIAETLVQERLFARLSGFFGGLAVLLACIGLYGLMAYAVTRRTGEMGIRMALGAQRRDILRLVMRETLVIVAVSVAIGIPAALAASRFVRSMLYGLKATDPLTTAVSALAMMFVALLAGYLPARRATKVDPMVALRYE
jgi:predicted permease